MEFSIAFTNSFKHSKVASENSIAPYRLALKSTINTNNWLSRVTTTLSYKKNLWGNSAQNMSTYHTTYTRLSVGCLNRELPLLELS